jgi:VanZ family protein
MFKWKLFQYKAVPLAWFLIMTVLFFLPGSALPQENWLDVIHFDKWVHVGLFAALMFLWRSAFDWKLPGYTLVLLISALVYGLLVEVIQGNWIPNRSFDLFDVVADMTGSILGLLFWGRVYKKNKPL